MPRDDTTTLILSKLDKIDGISVDVGVIKATMIDRESLTAAIAGCRASPPACTTDTATNGNGKRTAALISVIVALAGAIVYLVQAV